MDQLETCGVCGVGIQGDTVNFFFGPKGTRERLYARVCTYHNKDGCINRGVDPCSITPADQYGDLTQAELEQRIYAAASLQRVGEEIASRTMSPPQ